MNMDEHEFSIKMNVEKYGCKVGVFCEVMAAETKREKKKSVYHKFRWALKLLGRSYHGQLEEWLKLFSLRTHRENVIK